jgi:hypothetical protein
MISTKSEFMRLWDAGLLGNKLQTWNSIEDADYNGLFSIRSRRPDSRNTMYKVARSEVPDAIDRLVRLGERSSDLYFGEMAPDDRLTIQGEYLDGMLGGSASGIPRNKYLMWSTEQTQMKRVKVWSHNEGCASLAILRSYLNDNSWDDFQALLEGYPDHAIEFSAYECFVGNLPGRNTIIWEVRGY